VFLLILDLHLRGAVMRIFQRFQVAKLQNS
jgi:hypothetical protein